MTCLFGCFVHASVANVHARASWLRLMDFSRFCQFIASDEVESIKDPLTTQLSDQLDQSGPHIPTTVFS